MAIVLISCLFFFPSSQYLKGNLPTPASCATGRTVSLKAISLSLSLSLSLSPSSLYCGSSCGCPVRGIISECAGSCDMRSLHAVCHVTCGHYVQCPSPSVRIYHRRGARRWKKIRRINGHAFVAKRFQVTTFPLPSSPLPLYLPPSTSSPTSFTSPHAILTFPPSLTDGLL